MAKSTTLMIFTHKACSRSLHPIFYLGVVPGAAQGSGAATQGSAGAARLHPPKHYDCPLSHQRRNIVEPRDDVLGVPCDHLRLHPPNKIKRIECFAANVPFAETRDDQVCDDLFEQFNVLRRTHRRVNCEASILSVQGEGARVNLVQGEGVRVNLVQGALVQGGECLARVRLW